MSKKFMVVQRLVIPVLTLIVLLSQASPMFAMTNTEITTLMSTAPTVTLEIYNEPSKDVKLTEDSNTSLLNYLTSESDDSYVSVVSTSTAKTTQRPPAELAGYKNYMGIYPTAQLQNFPAMRAAVDKIFGVKSAFGEKSGVLYQFNDGMHQNPCYSQIVEGSRIWKEGKLGTPAVTQALKDAAKLSYKDIKGTEWYADKLALMTYYGVVGGTLAPNKVDYNFNGNSPVTRAEFNTMFYKFDSPSASVYGINWEGGKADLEKKLGGNTWYGPYVITNDDNNFISTSEGLNKALVNKPMTRMECTWLIMRAVFPKDTNKLLDKVHEPNSKVKTTFIDTKKVRDVYKDLKLYAVSQVTGETYKIEGSALKALNEMIAHPEKGIDKEMAAVIELARTKGIIGGSTNKSDWNKAVTRAEAIAMLHNVAVWNITHDRQA